MRLGCTVVSDEGEDARGRAAVASSGALACDTGVTTSIGTFAFPGGCVVARGAVALGAGALTPRWKSDQPAATMAAAAEKEISAVPTEGCTAAATLPGASNTSARRAPMEPTAVAVAMPADMNDRTAVSERSEKRDRPDTPWPDVQPLPSLVPNPTRAPAKTAAAGRRTRAALALPASDRPPALKSILAAPAPMRPATKEVRHPVREPSRP
jgi:hypothetical protein